MSERLTLTVEEAAELLGVSRGLAYEAARRGDLPVIRLGRRLVVPTARLLELVGAENGPPGEEATRSEETGGPRA